MGIAITRFNAIVPAGRVRAKTPDTADFTVPPTVTLSSNFKELIASQTLNDSSTTMRNGSVIRAGEKFTETSLRNLFLYEVKVLLNRSGSPIGTVFMTCRKSSDDSIVATATTTVNSASIPTSPTEYTFVFADNVQLPNEDFYIQAEFSGGSAGNSVNLYRQSSDVYSGGQFIYYDTIYNLVSTQDAYFKLYTGQGSPAGINDSNTTTFWKSDSESNPYAIIDFGSVQYIAGVRIYWNITGRPSRYKLQVGDIDDGATFDDTIVTFGAQPSANTYTNYIFGVRYKRYLKIVAEETLAMEIAELMVHTQTAEELIALHGHGEY